MIAVYIIALLGALSAELLIECRRRKREGARARRCARLSRRTVVLSAAPEIIRFRDIA